MGYDCLNIVSMNPTRAGLLSLPGDARRSYMRELLENIKPDIGVLPGDNPEMKKGVVTGYDQYMAPNNTDTMLLYETNKVQMKKQAISNNIFNDLDFLGNKQEQLVWPEVQVSTLKPTNEVVKTFSMITFHFSLFDSTSNIQAREILLQQLTAFAQRVAILTGYPILIAGEMHMSFSAVSNIVSTINQRTNSNFMKDQHAFLRFISGVDFTPSMLRGSTRDLRDNYKLKPIECKRKDPIVKTWESEIKADCFIASNALEMSSPTGIAIEKYMGQQVKMEALKGSCVNHASMQIPVRPPRHHGG